MKYLAYYIYSFLNLYYINVSGIYLMSYYNYLRYSSAFLISIYIVRSSRAGSSDSYIFVIYKLTL